MSTQNTLAVLLTAFGVIGLAFAPLKASSDGQIAVSSADTVALAISLGSHLRLERNGAPDTPETTATTATRKMMCSDVYRLQLADIGVGCHTVVSSKTMAFAN